VFHFPCFLIFSPSSRSYNVHFLFSKFFSVFCYNSGPEVSVSEVHLFHFFFLFSVFFFFCHIPDPTLWLSHFLRFFHFYRHILGPRVFIYHFSCFSVFVAIFQVI